MLYFAAIIEHGSLKKAARSLSISQPALSTSMDRFEQVIGDRLLERTPTGVVPTPLGEALYAHARLIRDELQRAEQRLNLAEVAKGTTIAFGTLPSLATGIVPTAVCRWREAHPKATLRIVEKNQLELLLSLMRGELDFIIAQTECYGFMDGMRQRVLFRDRLHILARPGHPVLDLQQPSWADLARFPWVLQMVGRQRTLLEKLLGNDADSLPEQLTESGSVDVIRGLVAGSESLAMLPAAAVIDDIRSGRIVPLDIDEPLLHRDIAVLFREGAPIAGPMRELVDHIAAVGQSYVHHQDTFAKTEAPPA